MKVALLYAELEKFAHEMVVKPLEEVGCKVEMVSYAKVARGKLKGFDAAFCLGSVGVLFWTSLHPLSFLFRYKLRRFVKRGGGVVGHCMASGSFAKKFVLPKISDLSFKGVGLLDAETTFPYAVNELTDLIMGFINMEELIGTVEYLEGNKIGAPPGKQKHFYDTGCAFGNTGDINVLARVVTCYKDGLEGNAYDICGTYGKGRVVLTNGNPELAMPFNLLVLSKVFGSDLLPLELTETLEAPKEWNPDLETLRAQLEWAAKKR